MEDMNEVNRRNRREKEIIVRWKIPVDLRRNVKIYQLQHNLTADRAAAEILAEFFKNKQAKR